MTKPNQMLGEILAFPEPSLEDAYKVYLWDNPERRLVDVKTLQAIHVSMLQEEEIYREK